jgi:hypothetical protein
MAEGHRPLGKRIRTINLRFSHSPGLTAKLPRRSKTVRLVSCCVPGVSDAKPKA